LLEVHLYRAVVKEAVVPKLNKAPIMKKYGGMKEMLHEFLISVDEWSAPLFPGNKPAMPIGSKHTEN
jgi:hypothetical protein